MGIIAFIVMFCWYMHTVGYGRLSMSRAESLGIIDGFKWYQIFLFAPVVFSVGFFVELSRSMLKLIISVFWGMRLAVDNEWVNKVLSEEEGTK